LELSSISAFPPELSFSVSVDGSLNRPLLARRRKSEVIVNLRLAAESLALALAVTILSPATAGAWVYKAVPAATGEPFASTSIDAPETPLAEQWRSVWTELQSDITALSQCGTQQDRCSSAASIRFGKILESARGRDGLIKLAIINGGVNAAIRYAGIQPARVEYPWSSAAAMFSSRRGTCMEFAIAKYMALLQSEWPANDIRLVLAWPDGASEPHMVLAARYAGRWYVLDNLRSAILTDARLENYVPLFVLDHLGVRKLVPEFIAADSPARDARASAHRRRMITTELRNNEPRPDGGTP
jgi:predicted transglutaminase-like cysteine proteinase